MSNRLEKLICIILLIAFPVTFSGCGLNSLIPGSSGEAKITDKPSYTFKLPDAALGEVEALSDAKNGTSKVYPADGTGIELKVKDKGGIEWTLEIPKGALDKRTEIKLTPYSSINSKTYPGKMSSGVKMEPDGLVFLLPATLTVKSPNGSKGILLTGDQKGGSLDFANEEPLDGGLKMPVYHFSSAYFDDPTTDGNFSKLMNTTEKDYQDALAALKAFLKSPIEIPAPPMVSLKKYKKSDDETINNYVKQFAGQEDVVMKRVLATGRDMALLGSQKAGDESIGYLTQYSDRILKKVDTLIKTYKNQPDYFLPVFRTAIFYWSSCSSIGGKDVPQLSLSDAHFVALYNWATGVAKTYLEDLKSKHDYSAVPALLALYPIIFFMNGSATNDYMDKLVSALSFKLEINEQYLRYKGNTVYKISGDIDLKPATPEVISTFLNNSSSGSNNAKGDFPDGMSLIGSGTMKYDSYVDKSGHKNSGDWALKGNPSFPVSIIVNNIDAVDKMTGDILVDRFGADKETYEHVAQPDDSASSTYMPSNASWVKSGTDSLLQNQKKFALGDSNFKVFTLPIQNMNVNAVEYNFEKGALELDLDSKLIIDFKLLHTPS